MQSTHRDGLGKPKNRDWFQNLHQKYRRMA